MEIHESTRVTDNHVNIAVNGGDLFEILCQRLIQHHGSYSGVHELADLLHGVLDGLVRELSGPERELAMDGIWRLESLFTQAASALRFALDVALIDTSSRLSHFAERFEQQLEQLCRLFARSGGGSRSATYIDRISFKDNMHALLETCRAIVRCPPPASPLEQMDLPSRE